MTDGQTDGRTHGHTSCHGIVRAMHTRRAVKIKLTVEPMSAAHLLTHLFIKFLIYDEQNITRTRRTSYSQTSYYKQEIRFVELGVCPMQLFHF